MRAHTERAVSVNAFVKLYFKSVLSDELVESGTTQNHSENVFRLIKVLDSKDYELQLRTNRFGLSAHKVVELFSKRNLSKVIVK